MAMKSRGTSGCERRRSFAAVTHSEGARRGTRRSGTGRARFPTASRTYGAAPHSSLDTTLNNAYRKRGMVEQVAQSAPETTAASVSIQTLRVAHLALLHMEIGARYAAEARDANEQTLRNHEQIREACDELATATGAKGRK